MGNAAPRSHESLNKRPAVRKGTSPSELLPRSQHFLQKNIVYCHCSLLPTRIRQKDMVYCWRAYTLWLSDREINLEASVCSVGGGIQLLGKKIQQSFYLAVSIVGYNTDLLGNSGMAICGVDNYILIEFKAYFRGWIYTWYCKLNQIPWLRRP